MSGEQKIRQEVDRRQRLSLYKDVIRVATADGHRLAMVRKRVQRKNPSRGAILLLHGFGQNRYSWHLKGRSLANFLAAEDWDVYNAELRGVGRSRKLGSPPAESFDEYVLYDLPALVEAARRSGEYDSIFLMGHSLGGAICYAGAPRLGDAVRGIVTLGGVFSFAAGNQPLKLLCQSAQLALRNLPAGEAPLTRLPLLPIGALICLTPQIFENPLFRLFPLKLHNPGSIDGDLLRQRLLAGFDWVSIGLADHLTRWGAEGRFDSRDGSVDYAGAFAKYSAPLLVLAGEDDQLVGPEDCRAAFLAAGSADKTFKVFSRRDDGAGFGHLDIIFGKKAPRVVWPLIAQWLKER